MKEAHGPSAQRQGHGRTALAMHLARPAPDSTRIGIAADHRDALGRLGQRQHIAGVAQQTMPCLAVSSDLAMALKSIFRRPAGFLSSPLA
jgi:hypothetical protein